MNELMDVQDVQLEASGPTKIWNSVFISVFIANCLLNLSQQMVQPLLTIYAKNFGATDVVIGVVASIFTITALILKFIAAPAIDTLNRKYILAIAMCVMGISFFGFSLSTSVGMIIAFRLLQGCGLAFTATCGLAIAADSLPFSKLSQGIGIFSLASVICQAIAPAIGTYIAKISSYRVTFTISAVLMVVAAISVFNIKTKFTRTKKFQISISNMIAKEVLFPTIVLLLIALSFFLISSYALIFANEQGIISPYFGLFFTIFAFTMLITRLALGKFADKIKTAYIIIPAMFMFSIGLVLISCSHTLWMFFLASFVTALGFGPLEPTLNAQSMKMVSQEKRGACSCTNYIGIDIGNLTGPILAGVIIQQFGYVTMWRAAAVPVLGAILITYIFRKKFVTAKILS